MIDAAHYLGVYDIDQIYSWTPKEFKNFVKGARLRQIDGFELSAVNALFTAKAQNSQRKVKLKDLYDAEQARKQINSVEGKKSDAIDLTRYRKAQEAMKGWHPQSEKKGG